jgi:1-aminocyclopropane-1-carboxylate deaminase/D-cysteine desulfhydrase-like pyridoxal-dependent ACC family enzyme
MDFEAITPVEAHGGFLVKREDLFADPDAPRVVGGKLRQVWHLAEGARGLVGFGGRRSNTAPALAAAGRRYGIPVRFHTASGPDTPEMALAEALGASVVRHAPGYLTVTRRRAEEDAHVRGFRLVARGDHAGVVTQVASLRDYPFKRVVLAAGAGVTLAGVAAGALACGLGKPILAVQIGAAVDHDYLTARVPGWRRFVTIKQTTEKYETAVEAKLGDLRLDPLYEAKLLPFLLEGDVIWNLGSRAP